MDLPEGLGIVALGALDYVLQIPPLNVFGLDLSGLRPFRRVLLASIKQYAAD